MSSKIVIATLAVSQTDMFKWLCINGSFSDFKDISEIVIENACI